VSGRNPIVFLFDVDDTLLDNDGFKADLRACLTQQLGPEACRRYWEIYEELRGELDYADFIGALERLRLERPRQARLPAVALYLLNYPFPERLYPGALDVVAGLKARGRPVILTDGDAVFQSHKIERSGLWDAFEQHMVLTIHKESELGEVEGQYPAERYVLIDDKLGILASVKGKWGDRVATVSVRQGHYANDPQNQAKFPPADITLSRIGELLDPELQEDLAG